MSAKSNAEFMREAIALSLKSAKIGEAPFGAVIVKDDKIIARGADRVKRKIDPTAHAEIIAIRQAASRLKKYDLSGCVIYLSSEPCQMCMAAIKQANIDKIYYACNKKDLEETDVLKRYSHSMLVKNKWFESVKMENILREEALESLEVWQKVTNEESKQEEKEI